ncbi:MAG: T9SS type A sorting domain-containing protein [Bacteroidetes bacterium]|nr:T9SS type A sorting domain-containing protein [Bacteroidota bacterium]
MRLKAWLLPVLLFCSLHFKAVAQVNTQDSLVLVDLYNSTNGPGWTNHTNWLTAEPVSKWYGITVVNGRVFNMILRNNRIIGALPSSLGNLSALVNIELQGNGLTGTIPSSLSNLSNLGNLNLSYNQFTGEIPSSFNNFSSPAFYGLDVSHNFLSGNIPAFTNVRGNFFFAYNQFNFSSFEAYTAYSSHPVIGQIREADLPLMDDNGILSVAAGGHLSQNTYKWYKDGGLVVTKTGDSTFTPGAAGNYSVVVTNPTVQIMLYSISNLNVQDSLVLVGLYNNTGGAGWTNHASWLTSAPAANWPGVTVRNGRVTELYLNSNNLTGNVPASLATLPNVTTLSFSNNQLSGPIPSELAHTPVLRDLYLSGNQLSGGIPAAFASGHTIQTLDFASNQLSGTIPAFSNLLQLSSLSLGGNQFTGPLPLITGVPYLSFLSLGGNQLTDTIPAGYSLLPLYDFIVTNNRLSGRIPNFLCTSRMQLLSLDQNQFTGPLPDSIGKLNSIAIVFLQKNQLSGPIPVGASKLQAGVIQSLNYNRLTFAGLENLPRYSTGALPAITPQANVPLVQQGDSLYVKVGGIPSTETFKFYKDGVLVGTQAGDSVFRFSGVGKYNIVSTSTVAPTLTLYSDTLDVKLSLPTATTNGSGVISGSGTTDVIKGSLLLGSLTPASGASGLSGKVNVLVTIDPPGRGYWVYPIVRRHYDITPEVNASTAKATVKLYFTQQEFDDYNAYVASFQFPLHLPLMPTGGVDNGNVRVVQYHGEFQGVNYPYNYGKDSVVIIPSVSWDAVNSWWVVSFPANGFSGFFVKTGVDPLTLPSVTTTGSQVISGSGTTDVINGSFKLVSLTPAAGAGGLSGNVSVLETVDAAGTDYGGTPYLRRHYDITPAVNASTAKATVTLYFTQEDFDAFNNYVTAHQLSVPLMPTGGVNNGNVRLVQYHGDFTGSSKPGNYGPDSLVVIPAVAWDADNAWWTVSFTVTGFSGFFVETGTTPLPLTLLQFTGEVEKGSVGLHWLTTNEVNTSRFVVERSGDGGVFSAIGTVAAKSGAGDNQYVFKDDRPLAGKNLYRLKMLDIDGVYSYSSVVVVGVVASGAPYVYPNPANDLASVVFRSAAGGKYSVRVVDAVGRVVERLAGVSVVGLNKVELLVRRYGPGVYTVVLTDAEHGSRSVRLVVK